MAYLRQGFDDRPDILFAVVDAHYGRKGEDLSDTKQAWWYHTLATLIQAEDVRRLKSKATQAAGTVREVGSGAVLVTADATVPLGETWERYPSVSKAVAAAKARGVKGALDRSMRAVELDIVAAKIPMAEERIEKLERKAKKMGLPPMRVEWGEDKIRRWRDEDGRERRTPLRVFRGLSRVLQHDGWQIKAAIDHSGAGDNLISIISPIDLTVAWESAAPSCDHCGFTRDRHKTFLVQHGTEGIKQVGRTCLKEYTGIDPTAALYAAEEIDELGDLDCDDEESERRGPASDIPVLTLLEAAAAVNRLGHWDKDDFYGDITKLLYRTKPVYAPDGTVLKIEPRDGELAREALLAARRTRRGAPGSYIANMHALVWPRALEQELAGASDDIVASAEIDIPPKWVKVPTSWLRVYARDRGEPREAKQKHGISKRIGRVGERLRGLVVDVFSSSSSTYQTAYRTNTTFWHLGRIGDDVVSFNYAEDLLENVLENKVVIDATVKKHSQSKKGEDRTDFTRATLRDQTVPTSSQKKAAIVQAIALLETRVMDHVRLPMRQTPGKPWLDKIQSGLMFVHGAQVPPALRQADRQALLDALYARGYYRTEGAADAASFAAYEAHMGDAAHWYRSVPDTVDAETFRLHTQGDVTSVDEIAFERWPAADEKQIWAHKAEDADHHL